MAWFSRFTRFADVHLVYAQEEENSCGIASVMMCVFKINKLRPGAAALHEEEEIYRVYSDASGTNYDGTGYSYTNHLRSTLNRLNVGTWTTENLGANQVTQKLIDVVGVTSGIGPTVNVTPMIVLVGWGRGGAHFVVVDTIRQIGTRQYATVCDPWDGDVHVTSITAGQPFNYNAAPVFGSWDLGGTRHEYSAPQTGVANWVIYPN